MSVFRIEDPKCKNRGPFNDARFTWGAAVQELEFNGVKLPNYNSRTKYPAPEHDPLIKGKLPPHTGISLYSKPLPGIVACTAQELDYWFPKPVREGLAELGLHLTEYEAPIDYEGKFQVVIDPAKAKVVAHHNLAKWEAPK